MLRVLKVGIEYQAVSGFNDFEGMQTVFIQAGSLLGIPEQLVTLEKKLRHFPEIVAILNCRLCFFSL